jgi:hypothetical protein
MRFIAVVLSAYMQDPGCQEQSQVHMDSADHLGEHHDLRTKIASTSMCLGRLPT